MDLVFRTDVAWAAIVWVREYRWVQGSRLAYVAILVFVLVGSSWLEALCRTRVFIRSKRLILSILPVVVLFFGWDAYAIANGHWWFDTDRILGLYLPGQVPVDEVLFFIVIPIASILTLEAVRSVQGWRVGDEDDRDDDDRDDDDRDDEEKDEAR